VARAAVAVLAFPAWNGWRHQWRAALWNSLTCLDCLHSGAAGDPGGPRQFAYCTRPDPLRRPGHRSPRRFGIASHLGVLLDVPAIGAAKTGSPAACRTAGRERRVTALLDGAETIGRCCEPVSA